MTGFLLAVHVLAAILAIGPVAIVRTLHRITRAYAIIGIMVPVFGLATGASLGVLTGDPGRISRKLAMHTGLFNLLWAIVVVLMIYRPGSTTGAGL